MSGEAGWYSDPSGRHQHRFWDGSHWSDSVADVGQRASDPLDPTFVSADPDPSTRPFEIPFDGNEVKVRWFETIWAMVVALVLFLPLGLVLLWRKPWHRRVRAGITAAVLLLCAGGAGATMYALRSTGSVPAAGPPIQAVLLDATGTGIQTTKKFRVPRNWDIQFSYDNCPGLDGTGTSIVSVWDARGQVDFAVNDVGTGGSDFARQFNGPDTVWLEVNSACSWNITVGSLPATLQPPPTSPPVITSTTTTLAHITIPSPKAPKPPRAHTRARHRPVLASRRHG